MGVGSGWFGLYVTFAPQGESFTIFRNWLALGRALPPGSARLQSSKPSKHMVNTQEAPVFCREGLWRKLTGFADGLDVGEEGGGRIKDASWALGLSRYPLI